MSICAGGWGCTVYLWNMKLPFHSGRVKGKVYVWKMKLPFFQEE